jgi:catechol 2,3-dioxygenase-like lactoylglutathione lyase family enzyme
MYFYGPDDEVLEIYTGDKSHRFNHFHHFSTDIDAAVKWYVDNLGLMPVESNPKIRVIRTDNINIVFHPKPPLPEGEDFEPTEGHVIDHVAFSFRDIVPAYERMEKNGVKIVRPIAKDDEFGHKSFYVLGPENILVEVVEDKPIPEGIWE